ncbi:uncharacterized protein LOC114257983 [Camellia sinensis]|uniref:uncharacterized protein LOC114257983 n=1 Tax=Camellia sinensis TaxID=4442 RepID=UPI0010363208|nr:uncharacterized protein LOC114257983 [Camellia sinensis]
MDNFNDDGDYDNDNNVVGSSQQLNHPHGNPYLMATVVVGTIYAENYLNKQPCRTSALTGHQWMLELQHDEYYLVDSGYPNTKGYLVPYKEERYHLAQFDHQHPQIAHEKFKKTHSSLRSVIERSFGVWKAIWPFMKDIPCNYNFVCQRQLVCATMAIHNFIRRTNLRDIAFDSYNKHIEYVLVDEEAVVGEDRHGHPIRNDDYEMDSRRYEILMSISQGNNY